MELIELASKIFYLSVRPPKDENGKTRKFGEELLVEKLQEWLPELYFENYFGKRVFIISYKTEGVIKNFFYTSKGEACFEIVNEDTKEKWNLGRKEFTLI